MSTSATATPERLDMDAQIGRRVFHLMWDRKITQTQMGKIVGVSQAALSKKLRGERPWYSSEIREAAYALNTTVAYLFGESSEVGPAGIEPTTSTVKAQRLASVISLTGARVA